MRFLKKEEFPGDLNQITDPPQRLHLRGRLPPKTNILLTVVGSREMTPYGKAACKYLIEGLCGYPISIVSGLARGIDCIAHKAALKANLHTIAIPGSGLSDESIYPKQNLSLAREIIKEGGCLLSEYDPNQKALPHLFPKRNRIMAGISSATLLIEAGEKSGTLITARLALDYNRDVLALPGSIFRKESKGSNLYLKLGATLITSPEDILLSLNLNPQKKKFA